MLKILIVDDSDALRSQLTKLFTAAGYQVIEAANGTLGVEAFKKHGAETSLVISDYNMPEMDGITMIRKIRGLPKGAEVPIFMLTTEASMELKATGKELGLRAWVTKPFTDEKLVAAVKKIVG